MFDRLKIGILTCIFLIHFKFCVDFKYLVRLHISMIKSELLRKNNVTKISQKVSKYTKKKLLYDRLRIGILTCIFLIYLKFCVDFKYLVRLHTSMTENELLRKNNMTKILPVNGIIIKT